MEPPRAKAPPFLSACPLRGGIKTILGGAAMNDLDQMRTILANERTLLAYVRTVLSAWLFGMAAIKFFPENFPLILLGWSVIAVGTTVFLRGISQYRKVQKTINQAKDL